ncbi:GNAT family N-acetyltransferase [Streptomyces sp. NPDC091278]|uniref:GNAT family N-acetyltransferase n=1 Tax=Streptomyces sp. NPDC091278 TaxID=3155301 RepID=UPI00344E38AC
MPDLHVGGWTETVVRELKGSMPLGGLLGLSLAADDTVLKLQLLRVSVGHRGQGHGARALARICAEADARGLIVACTPTTEFGADMNRLTDFYQRAGFAPDASEDRLTEHSWQRPPQCAPRG